MAANTESLMPKVLQRSSSFALLDNSIANSRAAKGQSSFALLDNSIANSRAARGQSSFALWDDSLLLFTHSTKLITTPHTD